MKTPALTSRTETELSAHTANLNIDQDSFFPANDRPDTSFFGLPALQPKLEIGSPDDPFEREADRVADRVMRMPEPTIQKFGDEEEELQMKREPAIQMKCEACSHEEELQRKPMIQRKSEGSQAASPEMTRSIYSLKGSGQTLPKKTQQEMETKMGTDFSGVRVHTGSNAIHLNRELGARAFTAGSDIFFNRGQYNPGSGEGKRLMAHELVHTVQQRANHAIQKQEGDQPAEIPVYVVDSSDAYGTLSGWTLSDPIVVTGAEDMVDQVIERIGDSQISYLSITDHGNPNSFLIGNDWISEQNFPNHTAALDRLTDHFAPGAAVHLTHCKIGQNEAVLCMLAALWGVNVYAGTGNDRTYIRHNVGDYMQCDAAGRYFPAIYRPSSDDFQTTPVDVLRNYLQQSTTLEWNIVQALISVMTRQEKQVLADDSEFMNAFTRRFRLSAEELNRLLGGRLPQSTIDRYSQNVCPSCHRDVVRSNERSEIPNFDWSGQSSQLESYGSLFERDPDLSSNALSPEQLEMLQQWLEDGRSE